LAKRRPVPAYDHLLKLSHTFNLLDARGAVGVTGGWLVVFARPGLGVVGSVGQASCVPGPLLHM